MSYAKYGHKYKYAKNELLRLLILVKFMLVNRIIYQANQE